MKALLFTFLIMLIFIKCKKDTDNSNCKLQQETSYDNNTISSSSRFEYDAMGRIIKITYGNSNTAETFTFYSDSVVTLNGGQRHTYFLNNNGLADSSVWISIGSQAGIKLYFKYTYNSEGYLVSQREILSQLYNGSILLDTSFSTFTVTNGNLVKFTTDQMTDEITYEYSGQVRPANNRELVAEFGKFPFLGKISRNLVSKVYHNGVLMYEISYEIDKKGNITKEKSKTSATGQTNFIDYSYSCN